MRRVSEVRAEGTAEWLEFVRQEYPLAAVQAVRWYLRGLRLGRVTAVGITPVAEPGPGL